MHLVVKEWVNGSIFLYFESLFLCASRWSFFYILYTKRGPSRRRHTVTIPQMSHFTLFLIFNTIILKPGLILFIQKKRNPTALASHSKSKVYIFCGGVNQMASIT